MNYITFLFSIIKIKRSIYKFDLYNGDINIIFLSFQQYDP